MNFQEMLERTWLAITLAEAGKQEWAQKILTDLEENRRHRERGVVAANLSVIELYLQSLCERSVKIENKKFFGTQHYLILVKNLTGLVTNRLIVAFQFLAENTAVEIIEKLSGWHLESVLRKAGYNTVLVNDEGLYVPRLGRLNPS